MISYVVVTSALKSLGSRQSAMPQRKSAAFYLRLPWTSPSISPQSRPPLLPRVHNLSYLSSPLLDLKGIGRIKEKHRSHRLFAASSAKYVRAAHCLLWPFRMVELLFVIEAAAFEWMRKMQWILDATCRRSARLVLRSGRMKVVVGFARMPEFYGDDAKHHLKHSRAKVRGT